MPGDNDDEKQGQPKRKLASFRRGSAKFPNPYYDEQIKVEWKATHKDASGFPSVQAMVSDLEKESKITETGGHIRVPEFDDPMDTEKAVRRGLLLAARTLSKGEALQARGGSGEQQFYVLKHAMALGIKLSPESIAAMRANFSELSPETKKIAGILAKAAEISNTLIASAGSNQEFGSDTHFEAIKERLLTQSAATLGMEPDEAVALFEQQYSDSPHQAKKSAPEAARQPLARRGSFPHSPEVKAAISRDRSSSTPPASVVAKEKAKKPELGWVQESDPFAPKK